MEFNKCDFCDEEFIKGKGHTCWCNECNKAHPMCNPCYEICLKEGTIKETPENKMIYSSETKDKMK